MRLSDPIVLFLCRLALIYGLLIVPWPGWNELYGGYFRAMGWMAFGQENQQRMVLFEPREIRHGFSELTTRMTLANRDLADSSGKARAVRVELDTRSIGWVPTALTMALILATPIPWKRRAWALICGLLLIHLFILFSLQTWIWDKSPDLSLMTISPFWRRVVAELDYETMTQLGASFSVPVLIWILVCFRGEDLAMFHQRLAGEEARPGGKNPAKELG